MPGTGTDRESEIVRLRLAQRVELLASAIDAMHRLDGSSQVLDRLVDLARQATIAPYGMLAVSAAADSDTVDFRTSGQLPDEIAGLAFERFSQLAGQLILRQAAASRLIQVSVVDGPDPPRLYMYCVPIHRHGMVIGILGVTMVNVGSTMDADKLRMLESLAQCAAIVVEIHHGDARS